MAANKQNTFYGDMTRWFIGRVVNIADPRLAGRVQVRIHGIHSENFTDISDEDLPWAECLVPTTEGGVSGIGRIPQLKESAMVFGIFLDGVKSQSPLVLGSLVHPELPTVAASQAAASRGDFTSTDIRNVSGTGAVTTATAKQILGTSPGLSEYRVSAMTFFIDNGIPPTGAAGIVGNLEQESGLNPTATNGIGAFGLAQWTPGSGRRQLLDRWMAQNGKNKDDFFDQLHYIMHEIGLPAGIADETNENGLRFNIGKRIMQSSRYTGGPYSNSTNAASNGNSTWVWLTQYEIPGNHLGEISRREGYAIQAYNDYQATVATSPSPT